ncbi:unnamed protein product [Calicophoron daubneyi]|uniref:Uncharacterized protein n=1 Tax=Calicophoron daubneyi TaxID=300641 RepID=A0AAV2T0R8_CALDB
MTNWSQLNKSKELLKSDIVKYRQMLNDESKPEADSDPEPPKKKSRPRRSKNGCRRRIADPSQPWLEEDDSDVPDVGNLDELDDDEYFRRLEEEKLREEAEEAERKRRVSRPRACNYPRKNIHGCGFIYYVASSKPQTGSLFTSLVGKIPVLILTSFTGDHSVEGTIVVTLSKRLGHLESAAFCQGITTSPQRSHTEQY